MRKSVEIQLTVSNHVPKYRQIIDSINHSISTGVLVKGDKIPSLNELCKTHNLSQDTVLMAYNELKARGIITSSIGKGYFVANTQIEGNHNVFLLFDKLNAYKEILYESFKDSFKNKGSVQIFFHYNNQKVYRSLIQSSVGEYSEYVIMPMDDKESVNVLALLPKNKIFIMDVGRNLIKGAYPCVCQDFENDIYRIFKKHEHLVSKYHRLVLITKNTRLHYKEIAKGFRDYCKQRPINYIIAGSVNEIEICRGDAFVLVDDHDLVTIVKQAKEKKLLPGTDLGIISYNESPLKEIIAEGITTISTDFHQMAVSMTDMILNGKKQKIDNPFLFTMRNSF